MLGEVGMQEEVVMQGEVGMLVEQVLHPKNNPRKRQNKIYHKLKE